jgi:aminoglycoside phosphotransferase (APT) family kinase protein
MADPELIAQRPDEILDTVRLEPYLRERLSLPAGPMRVAQFGGGHANLTYLLAFPGLELVLRRPPLGPIAPGSHDMGREHRVLSRLADHFPLAPRSLLFCEDEAVIGAPFQVMERRQGQVIRREIPAIYRDDPALLRRIGEMMIDVLADLHAVDRDRAGLAGLGHPDGFVKRQLDGWSRRWAAAAHEPSPQMDGLIAWLQDHLPDSADATLLHNDFKLDNMLLDERDPSLPVAVLDWDMCTSGDPLMDLGYLLNLWVEPQDPQSWIRTTALPTWVPGFPSRDETIARYHQRTGRSVDAIGWYQAFSAMKFAGIVQQIFIRFHRGQTRDRRFARYDQRARVFIDKGARLAGLAGATTGRTT